MRTLRLLLSITAFVFLLCSGLQAASFPDRYDEQIRRATHLYWGDYPDWLGWKAQLFQESRLRPDAVSPVGAKGIAQFMPGTWRDVMRAMGVRGAVSPADAALAIEAGAFYMAQLRRQWRAPRPALDRQQLAQASYNAGLGSLLRAQKLCGGPAAYDDIVICLPLSTGAHARETRSYVRMIAKWRALMAVEGEP